MKNAPSVILFIGAFAVMLMLAANQWANDARVLRKMRFIVPNETGPKDLSVRNENESD